MFANWSVDGAKDALVVLAKFPKSQNFKTTFRKNLTCLFLSVKGNSKNTVCHDRACKTTQEVLDYVAYAHAT